MRSLGADADAPRASLARGKRARVRVKLVRPTRPPQRVDHRTGASEEPPHGSSTPREPAVIVDRAKHSFFTPTNDRRKQVLRSKKDAKARGLSHDYFSPTRGPNVNITRVFEDAGGRRETRRKTGERRAKDPRETRERRRETPRDAERRQRPAAKDWRKTVTGEDSPKTRRGPGRGRSLARNDSRRVRRPRPSGRRTALRPS